MTIYRTITIRSYYWKPRIDYKVTISQLTRNHIINNDVVVVSEKAIAVAQERLCDESRKQPSLFAKFLAKIWMRIIWGYILGPFTRLSRLNIERIRNYPTIEGAAHKQTAILNVGFFQALRHSSEGGIDVSNLPYAYASLPLIKPEAIADDLKNYIKEALKTNIEVMIVDSDKTYTFYNLHISPRYSTLKGIYCMGIIAYILGRVLKLKPRSTPIAFTSSEINPERALRIASIANRARGDGAGKTIWDVAKRFDVHLTGVTWAMLERIPHYPVVIVREINI